MDTLNVYQLSEIEKPKLGYRSYPNNKYEEERKIYERLIKYRDYHRLTESIDILGLSTRAYKILNNFGVLLYAPSMGQYFYKIEYIWQLFLLEPDDLFSSSLCKKTRKEIRDKLKKICKFDVIPFTYYYEQDVYIRDAIFLRRLSLLTYLEIVSPIEMQRLLEIHFVRNSDITFKGINTKRLDKYMFSKYVEYNKTEIRLSSALNEYEKRT
jgi:hypothetical protein